MLRRNLLSTGALLALGSLLPATAGAAPARRNKGLLVQNAPGGWTGGGLGEGPLTVNVLIQRFTLDRRSRRLLAHGIVTKTSGAIGQFTAQPFVTTATLRTAGGASNRAAALAACQILNLDIGAINLNLLGLVINIAPISIDITAIPGGGLLGDLLCALAGLLSGTGPLGALQNLVSRLNNLLRTILLVLPI